MCFCIKKMFVKIIQANFIVSNAMELFLDPGHTVASTGGEKDEYVFDLEHFDVGIAV